MLNKKRALDDFQITEEMYDEMLVEFVQQTKETIVAIEQTMQRGAVQEAERCAHSLKGVAGNLRLDDCYTIAAALDGALKKDPPEPIDGYLVALKKALDEIRASVKVR